MRPTDVPLPNLDALAALAEKATHKGPWIAGGQKSDTPWIAQRASAFADIEPLDASDMEHAAACAPYTILALIARVKRAEEWIIGLGYYCDRDEDKSCGECVPCTINAPKEQP